MLLILVVTRVTPRHVRRAVDEAATAQRTEIRHVAAAVEAHRADTTRTADAIAAQRSRLSDIEGLLQLYVHETTAGAMPLSGLWAIDPANMSAALDAIARQRPRLVVELGGRTSTAWIARLLERQGSGRIVS